jgi:hypothetical protein
MQRKIIWVRQRMHRITYKIVLGVRWCRNTVLFNGFGLLDNSEILLQNSQTWINTFL